MRKNCKTPLRYPGGKSRAIKNIMPMIEKTLGKINEFRDPFLGGGSIPLELSKNNPDMKIWVNDIYYPLYCFWKTLKEDPKYLHECLMEIKKSNKNPDIARESFYNAKVLLESQSLNQKDTAVNFFVVNKCSFSGLTESSSFSQGASENNFTLKNIGNLPYYSDVIQKWKITNFDYYKLLENADEKILIYFDPPYNINNYLYGKKGKLHKKFDHELFIKNVSNIKCNSIISYNNDPVLAKKLTEEGSYNANSFDLTYTLRSVGDYMKNQSNRKELLLNNFTDS